MKPLWKEKKEVFLAAMSKYFDASSPMAHLTAKDGPTEDSDFKWLQVVRGERAGVAKMAGIDMVHQQEQRERERLEDIKKEKKERLERQKEKWEEKQKTKQSVTSEKLTEILKEAGIETENLDDDDNDSSGFDPDATFSGPPPKRSKSETFTLKFVDKEWIRKLAQWADKNRVSDVAFLELLQTLVMIGGGKIEDITLSLSTIHHLREDERKHAGLTL